VNTGLVGGGFGVGKRISLPHTREAIHMAISGELLQAPMEKDPIFGFRIPSTCGNVPGEILKPAQAWKDSSAYASDAKKLAAKFIKNFRQFKHDIPRAIAKSGPMLDGD
jgi:phosphoenolpyruvate carboxykinase (ATP)